MSLTLRLTELNTLSMTNPSYRGLLCLAMDGGGGGGGGYLSFGKGNFAAMKMSNHLFGKQV